MLVAIIADSHYFRVMRIPELSPAVFAHGLYFMWNKYAEKRKETQDNTRAPDVDDISVLTVDSSSKVASGAVADRDYNGHDHAPLNDNCNRAMPTDLAVGNDDVVSDADVNPMSSGDDDFVSAQGKYYSVYNPK